MERKGLKKSEEPEEKDFQDILNKRKIHAEILAAGYTKTKRMQEIFCITIFVVTLTFNILRFFNFMVTSVILNESLSQTGKLEVSLKSLIYFLTAVVTVDFLSGIVHWGFDTWGTVETPVFGPFIRSFREHHVAPTAMAQHDVVETNGDNCMLCLLASVPLSFFSISTLHSVTGNVVYSNSGVQSYWFAYIIGLMIFGALTNQIHKWTHTTKPPFWVTALQSVQIVMCKRVHNVHHSIPFDRYYCITTGWLNPILDWINFWKTAESFITNLTGAIPRADDHKRTM